MGLVKHFRDLRVYRTAFDAAMQIFELSKKWPSEERYSLTGQIRRSSRSVCEQIAEAWRKRRYSAHFRSKLTDADSEAAETQSWLEFALRCGYITKDQFVSLDAVYESINGGLVRMIDQSEQWCVFQPKVEEEGCDYLLSEQLTHSDTPALTNTPDGSRAEDDFTDE
ncbi:MAG TPA: four helix bundle protein [Pontiellaceae bacterium]|nr:four helix bundle protein [Pontiellaceae bacterium]